MMIGDSTDGTRDNAIWASFGLCLLLWVLPLEADMLFGLSRQYGFVVPLLAHLVITAGILGPLVLAWWRGVPARRLLSSLRVLFVLAMALLGAFVMAGMLSYAIRDGTLFVPPR